MSDIKFDVSFQTLLFYGLKLPPLFSLAKEVKSTEPVEKINNFKYKPS